MKAVLAVIAAGLGLAWYKGQEESFCLWTIDKDNPNDRCAFSCSKDKNSLKGEQKKYFSHSKNLRFEIKKTRAIDVKHCD